MTIIQKYYKYALACDNKCDVDISNKRGYHNVTYSVLGGRGGERGISSGARGGGRAGGSSSSSSSSKSPRRGGMGGAGSLDDSWRLSSSIWTGRTPAADGSAYINLLEVINNCL